MSAPALLISFALYFRHLPELAGWVWSGCGAIVVGIVYMVKCQAQMAVVPRPAVR